MNKLNTRNLVYIAFMSGLSFLFFMAEIKIFDPLAFDLSDIFVLLSAYHFGPLAGILVAINKNILHLIFMNSGVIGEVTNFMYVLIVLIPISLYKPKTIKEKIPLYVVVVLLTTVLINIFNYFIAMPVYGIPKEQRLAMIINVFVIFNLVKTSFILFIFEVINPFLEKLNL